jgi:large subunit ribosomal protein L30e
MENIAEMYVEETNPSNEIKGFTKSFTKRTKDKKTEDGNIKDLLNFVKEGKTQIGAKTTEKNFKNSRVEKVYVAQNCEEMTLSKIKHYAKLANVEVIQLDLNNSDLAQKMAKPFLINVVCIKKEANN